MYRIIGATGPTTLLAGRQPDGYGLHRARNAVQTPLLLASLRHHQKERKTSSEALRVVGIS